MICYKDKTFCSAKCNNKICPDNWEYLDKTGYEIWSRNFKNEEGPVAFADFSKVCEEYKEVK